jgi:hypothetical protein
MDGKRIASAVDVSQQHHQRNRLRHERRQSRACYPQRGDRPPTKDEERIECDIEHHRHQQKLERGLRITRATQCATDKEKSVRGWDGNKHHSQVVDAISERIAGRAHPGED